VGSGAEVSRWWRSRSVPLLKEGRLIRLAGDTPNDLVIVLELAEGGTPKVTSGSLEQKGSVYLVRPQGPGFRLEVA
jgi:hypothetical protein